MTPQTPPPSPNLADIQPLLLSLYPSLSSLSPQAQQALVGQIQWLRVPAGTVLFEDHGACQAFPFILEGSVRVSKIDPSSGREIVLYRVLPGESCVLTSSCLLSGQAYTARGVAERETLLGALPSTAFDRLVTTHEPFRYLVFKLFGERLTELMQLVEAVTFLRLDQRLAHLLLGKGRVVRATHQQLADELGSVREIVSRLLKSFAERGWVSLGREQIEILEPGELRRLAGTL